MIYLLCYVITYICCCIHTLPHANIYTLYMCMLYMCMLVIGDESWLSIGCPLRYYTKRAVFRRFIEMARSVTKQYNTPYIDTSAVLKAAVPWYWGTHDMIYCTYYQNYDP